MTDSQKWFALIGFVIAMWAIYLLAPILTPFVIGALLAYFGDPLADRLEAWKLGRTTSVIIVFTVMTLTLVLVLLLLIPTLERQVGRLIINLPVYAAWLKTTALPMLEQRLGIEEQLIDVDKATAILKAHWQKAGGIATNVLRSLSHSGLVIINWLMNLILIPVVTFYLLRDWDILVERIYDLLPRRYSPTIARLAAEVDEVLGAFLRGQFTVMLVLAGIYSAGLTLVGLDVALLIGLTAGLVSFIPYMGSFVGIASACIAALVQFQDLWQLLPVMLVFTVGQLVEGMVLTPLLVGDKIGLHPVVVIFAILAGGQLFGFLGILLALPAASVIMVIVRHAHDIYKDSDIYRLDVNVESDKNRLVDE